MSEKKSVSIRVLEINEVSFSLNPIPSHIEQIEFGKNLQYGFGFNFNIDHKTEIFNIRTIVNYTITDIKEAVVSLVVDIRFHVINLKEVVTFEKETKRLDIKNDFLATLIGVCIGTVRGVLSTNTKGTSYSKVPLPIVNSKDVVLKMKDSHIS
jgi:hypothetical protein